MGAGDAARFGEIPLGSCRLTIEQARQQRRFVGGRSLARVEERDPKVVLAIALDSQGASDRQVDDGGSCLSLIDLAVDQQAGLSHGDRRRRKRHRNRNVAIVGHDPYLLTRKRNGARRKICVASVAAFLAPPQQADNGCADR